MDLRDVITFQGKSVVQLFRSYHAAQMPSRYVTSLFHLFQKVELFTFIYASICPKNFRKFWNKHSDSEDALKEWFSEAENSSWESPSDIKKKYPHANILPDNRVVFNIKGNNYRLVVRINYDYGQVFIRFVGTHTEYDKIDATTI